MFTNPPLSWEGSTSKSNLFARIEWNFQICTESNISYPHLHASVGCCGGGQFTKKLLGIEWNCQICTENHFANSLPSWEVNLQKYFSYGMKYQLLHRDFVCNPSIPHGVEVSMFKFCFARKWVIYPDLDRKDMFTRSPPLWNGERMWVNFIKHNFTRNLMIYPYIHRKIMFANPHSSCWWQRVSLEINLLGIEWKIQIYTQHFMFTNVHLSWGWI